MDPFYKKIPVKVSRRIILHALLLVISLAIAVLLVENDSLHQFLEFTKGGGLILAAFVSGLFFASVFTTAIATASLLILGSDHNPLLVSTIAAAGSAIGDGIILKLIRNDLIADLEVLTQPLTRSLPHHLLQSKILHTPLAILAAVIIASPLPDELGITILGLIKFKPRNFYLLSFILNFLGILTITTLGNIF